jgi:hypothetical protein
MNLNRTKSETIAASRIQSQVISRTISRVTLFAALLIAACVFTGAASAQAAFDGKFTLTNPARWGKVTLGPGDYRVTLTSTPFIAAIYYEPSGRLATYVQCDNADGHAKGESALLIGHRGNVMVVHSFRVSELGETFIFDRTLASRQSAEEALSKDDVPVLEAKKQ